MDGISVDLYICIFLRYAFNSNSLRAGGATQRTRLSRQIRTKYLFNHVSNVSRMIKAEHLLPSLSHISYMCRSLPSTTKRDT